MSLDNGALAATTTSSTAASRPSRPSPRRRLRDRPRWVRWTTYAAVLLMLAAVGLVAAGVMTVRRPLPQTTGSITVPGLDAEVTVLRDGYGIPQVYADTAADLFYAQGYVQAQDRFFEMDVRRHVTAGRLSELFGETTLDTDKAIRTMGWRRVAEEELQLLSASTVRHLDAFSAGVNAYIRSHTPAEMSLEYTLLAMGGLDYQVEDWTPADSVSWIKAMAWDLRSNMADEIDRALASAQLDPAEVEELFPPYPYDRHEPVLPGGAVVAGRFQTLDAAGPATPTRFDGRQVRALRRVLGAAEAVPALVGTGEGVGSNAWVVDGEHSSTGQPILANDPHLAPTLPGVWYQMGLHCRRVTRECPYDVAGFTFAGLPGVVIGHNRRVAWGFTNLGPDVTDLYLERVDEETYLYGGRRRPLERREETIEVAGQRPVTITVRSTRHGPLLSDVSEELEDVGEAASSGAGPDREVAVALAWTALTPTATMDAVFELDRAEDWPSFRRASSRFSVPSQNMVYADVDGHIGYQAPGMIPIRKRGRRGDAPVPGWLPRNDWSGRYVPFEALPTELDPPEGFVSSANQAVVGPGYPYYLGDSWAYGYRSQRISDLIRRRGTLSVEGMSSLQMDERNGFAPVLVPYLLDISLDSAYDAGGQRLLRSWDFTQPADSAAAAYFNAVWRQVLAGAFHDDLPEEVWPDGSDRWFEVTRSLLTQPSSHWWDDRDTTDVREGRDDILARALVDGRDELVRLQSRTPRLWSWGHQHVLRLESQTVGQSGLWPVRQLLHRGEWELGGGSGIVNATGWIASEGYDVTWAPSMRQVVSLADLDDSRWVNLTGASGHAFSDHYTDQTELWTDGRTLPWAFSQSAVEAAADDSLTLRSGEG